MLAILRNLKPNAEQIRTYLYVLLGAAGPIGALLTSYGIDKTRYELWLQVVLMIGSPVIALYLAGRAKTEAKQVEAVQNLPAEQQVTALQNAPDDVKVKLAERVDGVSGVTVAANAPPSIAALADDPNHPKIEKE